MAVFNAKSTESMAYTKIWAKKGQTVEHGIGQIRRSLQFWSQPESAGVEVNVVAHEGGDEVVGVVVEGLHPQLDVVVVLGRRQEEVLGFQLRLQEAISCALVDQDGHLRDKINHQGP